MSIVGRWGQEVTIKRHARLEDVRLLDEREPDRQDCENLANGCYVVVESEGIERLYALAFLRADGGSREVHDEIGKLGDYPYAARTADELEAECRRGAK